MKRKPTEKIYNSLTNPKNVKNAAMIGVISMISALILGVIVAQFDTDGYNIFDNYISDMGSFNHTPFPYLLDFGLMITACSMIPALFYVEKLLAPLPQNAEDLREFSRMRLRLGSYGFIWMAIGLIGMFGVGFFSEDRTTSLGLHWIFTIVVFMLVAIG